MRQHVTLQELLESFTIAPSERELLGTKSGASRLGCAVLLKYFQVEGRFPTSWHGVPREVLRHLAQSFGVSPDAYRHYELDGRLARYHKDDIRQWTGFRQGNTTDAEAIKAWVCAHSRVDETTMVLSQFSCEAIWGMLSPSNLGCKGRESDDGGELQGGPFSAGDHSYGRAVVCGVPA